MTVTATHPPTTCVRCGAPASVTTEFKDAAGISHLYLLCAREHGMTVTWGDNS